MMELSELTHCAVALALASLTLGGLGGCSNEVGDVSSGLGQISEGPRIAPLYSGHIDFVTRLDEQTDPDHESDATSFTVRPWTPGSGLGARWADLDCVRREVTGAHWDACEAYCANEHGNCAAMCTHRFNEDTGGCTLVAGCMNCDEVPEVEPSDGGGDSGGGGVGDQP